jgi:hypothetical protein
MKEKSALMLRGVRDRITRQRGIVSGYQNNVYRVEFSNGDSVLRHRDQIADVDYLEDEEHSGIPDPARDRRQQRLSPGGYRARPLTTSDDVHYRTRMQGSKE